MGYQLPVSQDLAAGDKVTDVGGWPDATGAASARQQRDAIRAKGRRSRIRWTWVAVLLLVVCVGAPLVYSQLYQCLPLADCPTGSGTLLQIRNERSDTIDIHIDSPGRLPATLEFEPGEVAEIGVLIDSCSTAVVTALDEAGQEIARLDRTACGIHTWIFTASGNTVYVPGYVTGSPATVPT